MRNNFSLLTHKGRWLLATLTLLFTFAIGNVWANSSVSHTFSSGDVFTNSKITVNSDVYLTKRASHTSSLFNGNNFYIGSNDNYICVNVAEGDVIDSIKVTTYSAGSQVNSGKAFAYGESASDFSTSSSAGAFTYKAKIAFGNTSSVTGSGNLLGTAKVVPSISNCKSLVIGRKIGGTGDGTTFAVGKIEVFYTTSGGGGGCTANPAAPTKFEAGSITENGVTFTITDAANASSYDIYYSTSSTAPEATTAASATSTAKTKAITGLTASTKYYAWVRSVCDDSHKSAWVALTGGFFTTAAPDPCTTHHWFVATADATSNGVTNWNGFTNGVTGSSGQTNSVTIDGTTYSLTKRTGSTTGTNGIILGFTIPANKAGTLYGYMKSSGTGARTLSLKKGDEVVKTNTQISNGDWTLITIDAIAPGTYTLSPDQNVQVQMFVLKICDAEFNTITLEYADGVTPDGSIDVIDGTAATKPADPTWAHHRFDGWYNGQTAYDWSANVTGDLTLTAHWTQLYTVTYAAGDGTATGDAPTQVDKAAGETFKVAANTFAVEGKDFDKWNDGTNDYNPDDTYTVGTENVVLTAQWKTASAKYTVIFKDGDTELGTKLFEVGSVPSDADIEKTKPLYTFAAWQKDAADIALDAAFWATVVKDATVTLTARWEKLYASTIDIEKFIDDNGTSGNWQNYLSEHGYAISSTSDVSLDGGDGGNKPADKGLKIKKTGRTITFEVVANKLVTLKVGSLKNDGASISVNGGEYTALESANPLSTGASVYTYYHSNAVANYSIKTNGDDYCIIQSITIEDPYVVTFNANGGEEVTAATFCGTALTLPSATKGTEVFKGWYDAAEDGNLIGKAGESYTPTADITLYAQWETVSTDNTLSALEVDNVALADFDPDKHIYNIVCEYSHTPQITLATATAAAQGATVAISNTPVHYVDADNDFWYVQANVTPASGTPIGYNQVRYTNKPKQGATIFKAELTAANAADYSGLYADEANSQIALTEDPDNNNEYKFSGKSNFIKMAIADAAFAEGDILKMTYTTNPQQGELAIYDGTTKLQGTPYTNNTLTFSDAVGTNKSTLYIRRTDDNKFNAWVAAVEVQRYMNPFIDEFKIGEAAGTIDQVNKTIAVEVPYGTDVTALTPEIKAYANGGATLDKTGVQDFSSPVTYKVSSAYAEDGDVTYTVTVTVAPHYEAQIVGGASYATLVEAVAAATDGQTVKLLEDVTNGAGIMLTTAQSKEITIDFGGYTYTAVTPGVGSVGTQNQAFHLEKGNTVTLKNGTIACSGSEIKMLIQNYCNLTLENITLNGAGLEGSHRYVMSNNCGDVVIGDGTTITAKTGDVAFDVCATNYYPEGVKVTVEAGATVNGIVEYDVWGTKPADNKAELAIEGGTLNITWNVETALAEDAKENLNVSGGQFSEVVPADYCAEGFAPVTTPNAQGKYEVEDKRIYIFDGSYMTNMATSPSGAISWEIVGSTMGAGDKDKTYEGVHYTRALSCGNSSKTKHFKIDVALNNAAKIEVIGMSNSSDETRSAWLTNSTEKGDIADAIASLTTTGYNPEMFATDWLEEGSYYLHSDNTVAIFLIRVTSKEVDPKCEQPTITTQPATDLTFGAGNMTATVVAEVSDEGTLTYQWYNAANDEAVVGQTTATLTTAEEGTYYVIVTNTKASHRDNSIKSADATLAHRVMNDATLSALSYSGTAISLEADKYEYRVDLAMGTIDVPELTATATMAPYPTVVITNATEFVNYEATSTVLVTAEDGVTQKTYTVKFVVDHVYTALVDVTESTTWNWSGSTEAVINDVANKGLIIANYIDGANFEMIEGKENERARRNQNGGVYQGTHLHFNTTVAGKVKFYFRAPSSGENCTITVINNGKEMVAGTRGNSFGWSKEIVVKGDVVIEMVNDKQGGGETRVQQIVFTELTPDYTRNVTNNIGTLCVDHNVLVGGAMGATFYQIASRNELYNDKIDFEEVLPNEELKAGEPYIFKSTTGRIDLFFGETVKTTPVVVRGMHGILADGTLDITTDNMMDVYYIQDNKLRDCSNLISSGLNLVANRAYIVMSEVQTYAEYQEAQQNSNSAPRRRVTLGKDAEQIATGFENINAADKPMKLMINGQIFILRGEKMYDATGRLVK